jgi:hypothetical protein
VTENFPEYDWKLWLFNKTPVGLLDDWQFRKDAIDWFGNEIGIEKPEDWYRVSRKEFKEKRLWGLLSRQYSSSVFNLVNDLYPEIDWKPWLFNKAPNALWNDEVNWNEYLDWFEEKMEIIEPTDWYSVTRHDFVRLRGGALLSSKFSGSPQQVALHRNPEFPWKRWRFQQVADGYWENPDNCKQYLDYLAEIMEIKKVKDWYKITRKHFEENEGGGVLASFDLSPYAVISQHIEGEEWKPWLFGKAPNRFWQDEENQRWYMDWLAGELGITELDGWYIYDRDVLNRKKGGGLLSLYSTSLARILVTLYPRSQLGYPPITESGKNTEPDTQNHRGNISRRGGYFQFQTSRFEILGVKLQDGVGHLGSFYDASHRIPRRTALQGVHEGKFCWFGVGTRDLTEKRPGEARCMC